MSTGATPPDNEGDLMVLVKKGLISRTGAVYTLTAQGNIAQKEIWQAERYVAEHFATLA
jgi:hypothetical protein